jgi:hypothetical protein
MANDAMALYLMVLTNRNIDETFVLFLLLLFLLP